MRFQMKFMIRFWILIQEGDHLVDDPRNWTRNRSVVAGEYGDDEDEDDEDDEEEEDRSLDLLVRFVQNVFKKISKRTRKAVRSVLPVPISTKLVRSSNSSLCDLLKTSVKLKLTDF